MLAIAILIPLLSIKIANSQPPVKQYVAVDVEVFEEMQKTATQLREKLKEIEDLRRQVEELKEELRAMKEKKGNVREDSEEDFYF